MKDAKEKESKPKIVVIGLDGATFDLIQPWIESGELPTLASLVREGAHGILASTLPYSSCPAWKAFSTGKQPGKLGVYGFEIVPPDIYDSRYATALSFDTDELWDILGPSGIKCGVVNMPLMYPPHPINGFIVAGMLTPSERSEFTYPKDLKTELSRLADYSIMPNVLGDFLDVDRWCRTQYHLLDVHTKAFEHLLNEKDWDFMLLVYREVDAMQHHFWHYADRSHPRHQPQLVEQYGNVLQDYWKALDQRIGRLLKQVPSDTTIFLMSDHGFGPHHWQFNINDWLVLEGFLALENPQARSLASRLGLNRDRLRPWVEATGLGYAIRRFLSPEQRVKLVHKVPRAGGGRELRETRIDWTKTKAFALQGAESGGIYLNTADRPHGWINPGPEREFVRDELIARVEQLRHPETGELLGLEALRAEDAWWGDRLDDAPDILVLSPERPEMRFDPSIGNPDIIAPTHNHRFTAIHRREGILIAHGPSIRKGSEIQGAEIIDLAPTILHIFQVPIPEDIDGRVLRSLFYPDSELYQRPPAYQKARQTEENDYSEDALSAEEQKQLEDQLRGLGYLG
jgi:predicted AlkP superfamily phosphohydrolase/phosphomutase